MKDWTYQTKLIAMLSVVLLASSSGCAMSPWGAKKLAQKDPAQAYAERTAATIQYGTDVDAASNGGGFSTPASYTSSPSTDNGGASGGSCCQ